MFVEAAAGAFRVAAPLEEPASFRLLELNVLVPEKVLVPEEFMLPEITAAPEMVLVPLIRVPPAKVNASPEAPVWNSFR